jgi:hypothetical protein
MVESRFTATQRFKLWPQASFHTQWPGNGTVGDPIFNEFYKSTVQSLSNNTEEEQLITSAASVLLDTIGVSYIAIIYGSSLLNLCCLETVDSPHSLSSWHIRLAHCRCTPQPHSWHHRY